MHIKRAPFHVAGADCGDSSQTSPVLLSLTASLLNAANSTNRCAAGSALSQFGGMPLRSIVPALCARAAGALPDTQPVVNSPPSASTPIVTVKTIVSSSFPPLNKKNGTG